MFSFEGHYRKPRSINYSKQKDVGKKDLIENARSEREKRALLNRQIIRATLIQRAFRQYVVRKRNKTEAYNEYYKLIAEISQYYSDEKQFDAIFFKAIDYLFVFYDCTNLADDSLKCLINILIINDKIAKILANITNYYNAVSLNLLLRMIAKRLQSLPGNSPSVSYNMLIRFLEIFFNHLQNQHNYSDVRISCFYVKIMRLLLESRYFSHVAGFIDRQFLFHNEESSEIYNKLKVKSILQIVLKPIEIACNHGFLDAAIVRFVHNIYSSHKTHASNRLNILKLMNIAILGIVKLDHFIDIIYNQKAHIEFSLELLLLILNSVVDVQPHQLTAEISAKSMLLFYQISRSLFDERRLVLTNNLPNHIIAPASPLDRDEFDFDMEQTDRASTDEDNDDDDSSDRPFQTPVLVVQMSQIEQEIAVMLKTKFCQLIVPLALQTEHASIDCIGYLYHLLILDTKLISNSESKTFILNLIQTSKTVSRRLWRSIIEQKTESNEANKSLLQSLISGQLRSIDNDVKQFFGKLLCFANCLHWRLLSVQDLDLVKIDSHRSSSAASELMEFSPEELCDIVLKLRDVMYGLIMLIYDTKPLSAITKVTEQPAASVGSDKLVRMFVELQRVVIRLYNRDVRKGLQISGKRLEWVKPGICRINVHQFANWRHVLLDDYRLGGGSSPGQMSLSPSDHRQIAVLKEMPFLVPIGTRMKLFKQLLDSMHSPPPTQPHSVPIRVHRNNLYKDAFTQITKKSFANIRWNLKIEFVDHFGLTESGVDGGGLLREFLTAVIREACDPKRGLFVTTTNNLLYPNPELDTLYPDNWRSHLDLFGRMLGLLIFKGLLVEVPLAPFFIQKLFNGRSSREEIDIDNLQYLDEELYRNLLSLKSTPNVEDINLDFTVSRSCYGVTKIVELKPGGEHIAVTNSNKIEYIYLVADYKLNRQISAQTAAIIAGLDDVFPIECFQLFDLDEISFIITGGGSSIDLVDLRRNTIYHGIEDPDNSITIRHFWSVLFDMSDDEKRNFIQFVTSISRPPMLGFGELTPKFAIQIVQDTDRLPTASTCINLLRLPAYEKLEEMRQKLLYAIGSDSGFHLS